MFSPKIPLGPAQAGPFSFALPGAGKLREKQLRGSVPFQRRIA
jgi:hypothetical protein